MHFQAEERLRVGGVLWRDAGSRPAARNEVLFRLDAFEQRKGAFAQRLVGKVAAVGEEQGRGDVDEQKVERGSLQRFCAVGRGVPEVVMVLPVVRSRRSEQGAQAVGIGRLDDAR